MGGIYRVTELLVITFILSWVVWALFFGTKIFVTRYMTSQTIPSK